MKFRSILVGIVLVMVGAVVCVGAASEQNRPGQSQSQQKVTPPPPPPPPPPPHRRVDHDRDHDHDHDGDGRGPGAVTEILKNQQQILNLLTNLQNNTLPGQTQVLERIVGLQDSILAGQSLLIKEVSAFELACTTADLLPLPLPGGNFCDLQVTPGQPGKLRVKVHNQGGGAAGPSITSVLFHVVGAPGGLFCGADCAEVDLPTTALGGFGSAINLSVDVPAACYDAAHDSLGNGICEFKISVDGTSMVAESNESNNNAGGQCVRPLIIN